MPFETLRKKSDCPQSEDAECSEEEVENMRVGANDKEFEMSDFPSYEEECIKAESD